TSTALPAPAAPRDGATPSQRNAIAKARDYLSLSAFSRQGLIEQLAFEGFSNDDAVFAVDYLSPDWTDQARKKAAEYMSMSAFSEQGLTEQLVFEGFTQEQAAAGAASQF
ncbi:Ltp family lipoprotein, partial [Gordonia sp. (in: high G+C Gram-positive bacteria)]